MYMSKNRAWNPMVHLMQFKSLIDCSFDLDLLLVFIMFINRKIYYVLTEKFSNRKISYKYLKRLYAYFSNR